jgi:6-phosphogluconolactonase (cycloisomerase 2 family)
MSQLALASGIGLAVAATLTACQLVTVDYVFLAGSGGIQTFAVDSQSGALRYANGTGTKPISTGGSPVALAVDGTYADLYAANSDNNTVVHFTIDVSGNLTKADTITTNDVPVALAVTPNGSNLFVLTGTTTATLTEYSLSSGKIGSEVATESLGIPSYAGDTTVPTALTVLANGSAVYATVYDKSSYNPGGSTTSTANPGWVFGFGIGSGGALAATSNSPYRAGVKPSGIIAEPASRFLYVTDFASNQLIGYSLTSGTTLNFLISGPYKTGNQPSAVTIDPRGKFIYVTNALDSTVSAFAIDLTTGIPTAAISTTGASNNVTDTQPYGVVVEPAEGRYVYSSNMLGNSVSGFKLNPNTGVLTQTQATPYPSEKTPTAIVAVPHGNHSLQVVAD